MPLCHGHSASQPGTLARLRNIIPQQQYKPGQHGLRRTCRMFTFNSNHCLVHIVITRWILRMENDLSCIILSKNQEHILESTHFKQEIHIFSLLCPFQGSLLSPLLTRHLTTAHEYHCTTGKQYISQAGEMGGQCTYVKGYNNADPIEEQHEHIVSWSPVERT